MSKNSLLVLGLVVLLIVGYLDKIAFSYHLYWTYRWFDKPMHWLGGLALGFLGVYVLVFLTKKALENQSTLNIILAVVLASVILGTVWEFFEFKLTSGDTVDVRVKTLRVLEKGKKESASDLLFDVLGGLSTAGIILTTNKFNRKKENNNGEES